MTTGAAICLSLGIFICAANWVIFYHTLKTKQFMSSIPLVGAGLLFLGMFNTEGLRDFAFVALFLDYGTIMFMLSLPFMFREDRRAKSVTNDALNE